MVNLLVTGGAGFIGSHFVDFALTMLPLNGHITILDKLTYAADLRNLQNALKDSRVTFVNGDICSESDLESVFNNITHVINFAAESHVDRSIVDAADFVQTNIVGVQKLLDACLKHGVMKYLQISTDEVYGSISNGSWNEDSNLEPNSPYSASKASADLLVRSYWKTHNLHVNITRCSNNYGTRQYPEKLIPYFVKLLVNQERIPVYGDGLNFRDWLHVVDHCRAIWLVLISGIPGRIYNIGGGREVRNIEMAKLIISLVPKASNSQIEFVVDRKGHDFRYSVDWSRVKNELGFQPLISFELGLDETVRHYCDKFRK